MHQQTTPLNIKAFDQWPNPDKVQAAEYRELYELVQSVREQATQDGDLHPDVAMSATLQELHGWIQHLSDVNSPKLKPDVTVKVGLMTDDIESYNPRGAMAFNCNEGVMLCRYRDYKLGDVPFSSEAAQIWDGLVVQLEEGGWSAALDWLRNEHDAKLVLPLYVYDHGGITITAGDPKRFGNSYARGIFAGDAAGWDTSFVGIIYGPDDSSDGLDKLISEVDTYDQYLQGELYEWEVCTYGDPNNVLDSGRGYYSESAAREDALACAAEHGTALDLSD